MSVSLQELSASFYRLRALPSAFSVSNDAERTWVPEVDTFQGEKHQVMLVSHHVYHYRMYLQDI
jgi:hypothetical protein